MQLVLTTELIVEAYRQGLFPMAYNAGSPYIHWICPEMRGQLSIEKMHIPRRLKKTVRGGEYEITIDKCFDEVIKACAESKETRPETWINEPILKAYCKLHRDGYAHSIECWKDGKLAGGLYGVAIGSAFFGESMFSRQTDASKVALVHLVARLWKGGFKLLDTQFINEHLKQFGATEVPHREYLSKLRMVHGNIANFRLPGIPETDIIRDYFNMRNG